MAEDSSHLGSERSSSASSDFYNAPVTDKSLELLSMPAVGMAHRESRHDEDEDSGSEMDVSEPSRSPTPEPELARAAYAALSPLIPAKRKANATNGVSCDSVEGQAKKRKLSFPTHSRSDTYQARDLPPELWQHLFTFLSPANLAHCLRVCRKFNILLTTTKAQPLVKKNQNRPRMIESEAIWTQARKAYFSQLPRPLLGFSELQMLQLIATRECQFCHRIPVPAPASTPFNAGPGPDGVRVIWPFGIRTCGSCLQNNTLTDIDVLKSEAASLRAGLPYAFRTQDLHFVLEMTRQSPGGIPSHLRVAKIYYNRDVAAILHEWDDAKGFGDGAADEWRKGLPSKGKDTMSDASRWEKWETQPRLSSGPSHALREYDSASFPRYFEAAQSKSAGVKANHMPVASNGKHALPQPVYTNHSHHSLLPQPLTPALPPTQRPMRNLAEVEHARQARKAYIEQRCLELEPPLRSNVLQHIESFQAAMQITTPINDSQWDMLRPRILAQREAAELIEHQKAEQYAALQSAIPSTAHDEAFLKPAREVYDREYDQAQELLRRRLSEYADDIINGQWHGGQGLDPNNAPGFAIQILSHVYNRYTEDKNAGRLDLEPTARIQGPKQGSPPAEPFLSLDNMKWVYDNKVRTLTDQYRRELFICAGCTEEQKPIKWFAFEGLIQHYGAKHTTAFSKGNIVVHWQTAEWPGELGETPFEPNPAPYHKLDRKIGGFKGYGLVRQIPQTRHEDQFSLSHSGDGSFQESQMVAGLEKSLGGSNGHQNGGGPYSLYQHAQHGHSHLQQVVEHQTSEEIYAAQLSLMTTDARPVWDALDGIKNLLSCIRMHTVIHYVVARFREQYHQQPTLDMLTDALLTNPEMRPMKEAHGLACKSCVASQTDGAASSESYFARIRSVKLFNISSLITHFKINHSKDGHTHLNWTTDMIEVPEVQIVSGLVQSPGMNDEKLALIAGAFPGAFSRTLPKIGQIPDTVDDTRKDTGLAARVLGLGKKTKSSKKKGNPRGKSQEPMPEPAEDEYDPRRPMVPQRQEHELDPARFDTDLARKSSASVVQPPAAPLSEFGLSAETRAALSNLTALSAKQATFQQEHAATRSPSVGRAATLSTALQPTAVTGQPDIAAILASLRGGTGAPAPIAPPPTSLSNRSGSASCYPPTDPYGLPPQPGHRSYRPGSQHPTTLFAPPSAVESPGRYNPVDQQAALARNHRQHEQNQQVRAPAERSSNAASQPRSPPRYRYVYDNQPPPLTHPVYREAPVQYIQLPAEHHQYAPQVQHQHIEYRYERPKPVYVDEYGRPLELIPIEDSAPAPIQYVPHPYDPQQPTPRPVTYQPRPSSQQMYYEPASQHQHQHVGPRYTYEDDSRGSVSRD